MLWTWQAQRLLIQSTRISTSKLPHISTTFCKGCLQRHFSQRGLQPPSILHHKPLQSNNPLCSLKRLLATSGDPREDTQTESSAGNVQKPEGVGGDASNTAVKGAQSGKSKSTRKKTDFNKEYPDNIYIEYDRARFEYLLTEEQLNKLPTIIRRSPYPGSDNIKVFHRQHIMKKVVEVWGSLENLHKEKQSRQQWENLDSYLFKLRRAQQTYKIQHIGKTEEKPYIFKPYEKPSNSGTETIFKSGSGRVVLWAVTVNGFNALLKFAAWLYTGSHSLFAECIHSIADTVNQVILAVGIHQSLKQADLEHPYGWSNFRNVASLISGVGIFCLGAGFSIYHGVMGLLHPHTIDSLYWGIAILFGSFLSEGGTLIVAIKETQRSAKRENMSFSNYVWYGRDPSTNVVLLEDAAAVLGVTVAATCMGISYYTGNPFADAVGSILIGTLLGGVASFIIYTNTISLVGRSIPIDQKAKLMAELENDRMIRALHDVKATDMGGKSVRFKAEVDFDGKEVTRSYLDKSDLDTLLNEVQCIKTSEELETFMLKHGENIVDTLGGEVDRIEKNLKKRHPEVRHVDLEQL